MLRRFIAALSDAQKEVWPTFSALLAGRLAHRNFAGEAQPPTFIDFAGPPGTFPRISFQGLLRPDARLDPAIGAVKDRVVIVAPETRFQDIHLIPYARGFPKWRPQMMSGTEVHANIVETLQMGRSPRAMMGPWRVAATCAVLALATYAFFHLSPWHGVLLTGMGSDGAAELALMKERGAITIAQDKESSVVHGIPGEAIKLGAAMYVLAPEQIAQLLKALVENKAAAG